MPPESVTEPRSLPVVVSKKSTLPVGVPEPGALAVTVALSVIDRPNGPLVVEAAGHGGARVLVDRQRAGDIADRVVGVDRAAGGDRVGADRARGRRRRGDGRQGRQVGRGVAVDEPRVTDRQRRVGLSVDFGLVIGRDGQRGSVHGQRAGHIADSVVGVDRTAGSDRVAANRALGRRRRRDGTADSSDCRRVAVDEATVGGRQDGQ